MLIDDDEPDAPNYHPARAALAALLVTAKALASEIGASELAGRLGREAVRLLPSEYEMAVGRALLAPAFEVYLRAKLATRADVLRAVAAHDQAMGAK